jgi:hypothetical protein
MNIRISSKLAESECPGTTSIALGIWSGALFATRGKEIANNSIDRHMTKQETKLIVLDAEGKRRKPEVRNHGIKVYQSRLNGGGGY